MLYSGCEQQAHLERRRNQVEKELRKLDANSEAVEDVQVTLLRMKNMQLIQNLQSFAQDDSGLQQTLLQLFHEFDIQQDGEVGGNYGGASDLSEGARMQAMEG